MKHVIFVPAFLLVLLLGCASTSDSGNPSVTANKQDSAADPAEKARELDALEGKLMVARARMAKLRLEHELAETQLATSVRHGQAEVAAAQAALARFREVDAPNQLASQKLDLRTATDRAQEAAEELEQIEIMYKEQDLDDLTAEFVVSRGKRSAERAAARIGIQQNKLRSLEEREHPEKMHGLELGLDKAVSGLKSVEMKGKIAEHGQAIDIQEAENEIERLEHELVDLRKEDTP